ncbi:DUF3322 domain-containing protein [Halorhodospira sp. 9622]|uniref:DUF3322 domain-containing protein n=1 Tax=Halorhodospira sp. 9622 TaxID=2899136 RepID=UPI001EE9004D|nr:DUF3322 domain-containing protein [Halorhodospira sp. 9622]MCG5539410.1 DUF3322 domain-containing protein [Halorhodospira sp. 9622]
MRRWSTPEAVRERLERLWSRGTLLAARVPTAEAPEPFPVEVSLTRPRTHEINEDLGAVADWADGLRRGSREGRGFGYDLRWQAQRNRVHGRQELPTAAVVPCAEDALKILGRRREAAAFDAVASATAEQAAELLPWLARRPLTALEHAEDWPKLLAVCAWFRDHPRPEIYLRQLDIPGVDTKFIESRRRLLGELLDLVLPAEAVDTRYTGARGFEARYGLRQAPTRIRLRLLDPELAIRGLTDLAVPVEELARLDLAADTPPLRQLLITENQATGLALPPVPGTAAILGLGYAVDALGAVPWLERVPIAYWGDLDRDGFAILDRLRGVWPHTRSLLMDRATLAAHRHLCVPDPRGAASAAPPERLTHEEAATLAELQAGDAEAGPLRLEQERIGMGWAEERIPGDNQATLS